MRRMMDNASFEEKPERKKNRLKDYDYSQSGAYFITICVKDKQNLLWDGMNVGAHSVRPHLPDAQFTLSSVGTVAEKAIKNIEKIYESVTVDKYIVMPNHIHMILVLGKNLNGDGGAHCAPLQCPVDLQVVKQNPAISRIIKQFKEYVTKQAGYPVWQKSYHDRIIRNEKEYQRIWQYIESNPLNWEFDCYFKPKD